MKIVALETSSDYCSIAIQGNTQIFEKYNHVPRQHAQLLVSWLAELCEAANLDMSEETAIAYSRGPGSFTGIRVAAAVAQGLALTHNLPLIAISTLQVIAEGAHRLHGVSDVMIIQDARMQQVYYGHYRINTGGSMSPVIEDKLCQLAGIKSDVVDSECYLISDMDNDSLMTHFGSKFKGIISNHSPNAIDVLTLAQVRIQGGVVDSFDQSLPVYLQSENTWKKLKET